MPAPRTLAIIAAAALAPLCSLQHARAVTLQDGEVPGQVVITPPAAPIPGSAAHPANNAGYSLQIVPTDNSPVVSLNFVESKNEVVVSPGASLPGIPEPLSIALLPFGLAALALRRKFAH